MTTKLQKTWQGLHTWIGCGKYGLNLGILQNERRNETSFGSDFGRSCLENNQIHVNSYYLEDIKSDTVDYGEETS